MIIDSVTDKGSINIGTLSFEFPERKERYFNAEREVREADWQEMSTFVKARRETGDWDSGVGVAAMMSLLFPDRKDDWQIREEDWPKIKFWVTRKQQSDRKGLDPWVFSYRASRVKMIAPEKINGLTLGENVLTALRKDVDDSFRRFSAQTSSFYQPVWALTGMVQAKIMFPSETGDLQVGDLFWDKFKVLWLDQLKSGSVPFPGKLFDHARAMMALKLLDQDKVNQVLDQWFWEKSLEYFKSIRKDENWTQFAVLAAALKILDADVARITSQGKIEVIVDKNSSEMQERIPDMPVRRKF